MIFITSDLLIMLGGALGMTWTTFLISQAVLAFCHPSISSIYRSDGTPC
jgi:hypothetical protein